MASPKVKNLRLRRKDGSIKKLKLRIFPKAKSGPKKGLDFFDTEIARKKSKKRRLVQKRDNKGRFA